MAGYVNSGSTFTGLKSDTIRQFTTADGRHYIETKAICGEIRQMEDYLGGQTDASGLSKLRVERFAVRDQLSKGLSEARCKKDPRLWPKREEAQLRLKEIDRCLAQANGPAGLETMAAD